MTAPAGSAALSWLADALDERVAAGLHRVLTPRPPGPGRLLDLAGNDYLGLGRHPDVAAGAARALQDYGAGSTGSRLVTGTTRLHAELESALSCFIGTTQALVFSSGYLANLGAVSALAGTGTLIVSDEANHASVVDACRLSRARVVVTPHADVTAVEKVLADRAERRALVVTDAIFSVDGDPAPLAALHAAARRHDAALLVDEAHSFGVVGDGRGAAALAGLAGEPDVVLTVTLSKALGGQGGAVLGPAGLRDQVVDTARSFIFDTALAPPAVGAALAALALVTPERTSRLRQVGDRLAEALRQAGIAVDRGAGAVVAVPVGDPHRAAQARDACLREGLAVGCFRPPAVGAGRSCLRLTARADLDDDDLLRTADVVRRALSAGPLSAGPLPA